MVWAQAAMPIVSQVVDSAHFDLLCREGAETCLCNRLKLVLNPIHTRMPLPVSATDPEIFPARSCGTVGPRYAGYFN